MKKFLCLLLCTAISLSACDYYSINSMITEEVLESPRISSMSELVDKSSGGHFGSGLNLSMRLPLTLNPLLNNDESVDNILKLLFEPLFEVKENMHPSPNLLSRLDFSPDGKSAHAVIREDAFWSDGTKLTSADVKFSIETLKIPEANTAYQKITKDIINIEIVDNSSFKINFSAAQGGVGYSLCFPVIPQHYYRNRLSESRTEILMPLGNGLYKVSNIRTVKEITLEMNEYSFRNKPFLENIRVFILDDKQTAFQAFEQNIIDAIDTDFITFGRYSGSKSSEIWSYDTNYYTFLGFNFKSLLFENKGIRQAIAHAIDKNYAIDSIYLNKAQKAVSVINPTSYLFEPTAKNYEYDLETARNILFQAGYRDNNLDGILDVELAGTTRRLEFRLLVNEESAERLKIAQNIKDNLDKLGLLINIVACDFETFQERLLSGNFDMVIGAYNFSLDPDFRFAFHSESRGDGNYLSYRSETLDNLIESAESARTEPELKNAVSNIQKHIAEELPCIGIAFVQRALLTEPGIKGDKNPLMNNIYSGIDQWKIE